VDGAAATVLGCVLVRRPLWSHHGTTETRGGQRIWPASGCPTPGHATASRARPSV